MPSTGKLSTFVIVPGKLNDLKTVKLEGFADEKKEIFMARRLLPLFRDNNPIIISKSKGKYLKHLVKVAKLEKKGNLEHFLDISNFSPSKFIVTESGESIPNEAYTLFAKQDCALAPWILSTVSPNILPQLVGAKTSAFVWSTLAHLFLYLSITKVMLLYCKLRSHYKGAIFMRYYLSQIKEVCDTLIACDSPISTIEHSATILNSLHRDYNSFVTIITSRH
ncbi:hypothetical protein GOBAR_AA23372 [Gossypium barbadense]|uniref:Uncharacterized protein n=1 Tax=Gossypium barbadense TaxID=3634 RepID=A0A2P5X1S8_GOSBA|nr:hypothetical protein GOBAR_AA23372 [Gossypium barbadense]